MPKESDLAVAGRFGRNLRRARGREDMTQEELAARAGLHRTAIGLLEGGGRVPRIDTLVRLADSMGVSPDALLDGICWVPGTGPDGAFVLGYADQRRRRRRQGV